MAVILIIWKSDGSYTDNRKSVSCYNDNLEM